MNFYTNIISIGDNILVRGVRNGRRYTDRVPFKPTLYINSQNPVTEWHSLYGANIESVEFGSIREARDFVKRYEDVSGFDIHGNTNYAYQYISDVYKGDISWDMENISVYTIDIEVAAENGFPDIRLANEEVLLITVKDLKNKSIMSFGYSPNSSNFVNKRKDVTYLNFATERELLLSFTSWWQSNCPDVVTGWNIDFFDIPYLVKRIMRELGESFAKKLSPWGMITERNTYIKGSEELHYDISGVSILDYLELYKKYTYSKQESYRLDYIAGVELGDKKKTNPGDSFKEFYRKYWQKFVEYNIHDVELVDKLEDKMRLIELQLTMAFNAKINFEDVYSQVRMWDNIIYCHLMKRKIAIPMKSKSGKFDQFEGAYVKDPLVGQHKWVASFDLNSLYPHLIMQYNISPETLVDYKLSVTVDKLLNQEIDISQAKQNNLSVTANGWCYRRDTKGFMAELMETMYNNRSKFKKQMLKVQQEYENDKSKKHLLKEISRLNNLQMAMKIALNSAYGAMGNNYFRYFDIRMAEGITTSGQLSIRWMSNRLNELMNNTLKTKNKDYIIAVDTDSIYLSLEKIVETVMPNKTTAEKIKYMDRVCDEIFQPFIDNGYKELAEYMNAYDQKMQMKREVLADKGIWTAKKRYILNVHNSEGVQYVEPKLKMMGIETIKSSTPASCRKALSTALKIIMSKNESDLQTFIQEFSKAFRELPFEDIAFPRGVQGIKKYSKDDATAIPIHVRGAITYNKRIDDLKLSQKYQKIEEGAKIKYCYMKMPNPLHENILSILHDLPKEFQLDNYIDYDLQFEKAFLEPLRAILKVIGWSEEKRNKIDDFFV